MNLESLRQITRMSAGRAYALLVLLVTGISQPAFAEPEGITPQAETLLKASTEFLASQQRFSLDTLSSIEVVLTSGQKIQYDHTAKLSVLRPNKMLAQRTGELVDQAFYYDGKSIVLHNPSQKYYASVAAPDTLETMLDFAREKLDIVAPAGDMLYKNAFQILTQDVTSGFVVGKGVVEGVRCDHLAFRSPFVDWQIWVEEGKRPLPRKLVLTTRDVVNAPQFTVVVTNWNLEPGLTDATFKFTPSKGERKVEFTEMAATASQAR